MDGIYNITVYTYLVSEKPSQLKCKCIYICDGCFSYSKCREAAAISVLPIERVL